jgi:hypothetical protein
VLVSEDGLLYFAKNDLENALAAAQRTPAAERSNDQRELLARVTYYDTYDVAFVARPYPEPGVPGTERPGRFRKASNLNYTLRLADRLEGGAPLSTEHAHFRDAVPDHVFRLGRCHGDVRVGDIIVQLDKDSVIAPDVIRATVPEFLADPTLAYTQHSSYPTNEERYFSVVVGWFTRLLYDISIRSKCLVPGTLTPLMGHNLFLRRADLFRVGGWYEHSVCEDLELSLRLHESGQPRQVHLLSRTRLRRSGDRGLHRGAREVPALRLRRGREHPEPDLGMGDARDRQAVVETVLPLRARALVPGHRPGQFFFSLINLASLVPLAVATGSASSTPTARSA